MRKYIEFIRISFKELLAYRFFFFTGIIQRLLRLLIQLFVWQAFIGQSGVTTSLEGTITIAEMTAYVVVSTMLASLLVSDVIWDINERVRFGRISMDLIKPMNMMTHMLSRMSGWSLFTLIFQMIPILVIALIFLNLQLPSWQFLMFFLVSVVGAFMITFFMTFILGLLSFWYMQMWQVEQLMEALINLFAGSWIPLWFFPEAFNAVSSFLPFRLMYYMPITIFLEKLDSGECWFVILQQVIWIGILYGVSRLVWNAATKKLVIQGG